MFRERRVDYHNSLLGEWWSDRDMTFVRYGANTGKFQECLSVHEHKVWTFSFTVTRQLNHENNHFRYRLPQNLFVFCPDLVISLQKSLFILFPVKFKYHCLRLNVNRQWCTLKESN